jgi:hypothetical protein
LSPRSIPRKLPGVMQLAATSDRDEQHPRQHRI